MSTNTPRFECAQGQLFFYMGDTLVYSTREAIAFLFDEESGTLFEHGPVSQVEQTRLSYNTAYNKIGVPDMELVTLAFTPDQYDPELFTRFVDTHGTLRSWCVHGASGEILAT